MGSKPGTPVRLVVHKYGGTSVGSIERIQAVARKVATACQSGDRVVVVVSAMSGETNRLTALAHEISSHPAPREFDVLLASGEQVSIALLTMALHEYGIKSKSFLADQIRVRTNNDHIRARIEKIDGDNVLSVINDDIVPVIAGFQGVDDCGDITTIGRGGSDTSAVAVAAAIEADECLIYTDVDGVYTADPNVVSGAKRLAHVNFEEMLELASLGAKVLHSRAVEFAHKFAVPIRVLSSFEEGEGTLISQNDTDLERPVISGVTFEKEIAKLTVSNVNDVPGVAFEILGPIGNAGIVVDMIVQNVSHRGHTDLSFTVPAGDMAVALEILEDVAKQEAFTGSVVDGAQGIAKVTVVGVGMRSSAGVARKMFETLAEKNINIMMISTSEIKISVVIDASYVELATRALHSAFDLDAKPVASEPP